MIKPIFWGVLCLAFRNYAEIIKPLCFFLIIITLFPLSIGPEPQWLRQIAPGIVWVAALLSSLLSMDRLFRDDWQDGSLQQMMFMPVPLSLVVPLLIFSTAAVGAAQMQLPVDCYQRTMFKERLLFVALTGRKKSTPPH